MQMILNYSGSMTEIFMEEIINAFVFQNILVLDTWLLLVLACRCVEVICIIMIFGSFGLMHG